jgi:hypothetical protein
MVAGPNFYSLGRDMQRARDEEFIDSDTQSMFATTLPQGQFRVKHKITQHQHDIGRNTQKVPPLAQIKKLKQTHIPISRTTGQGSPKAKMMRPRTAQGIKPPLGMNVAVHTQRGAYTPNNHD